MNEIRKVEGKGSGRDAECVRSGYEAPKLRRLGALRELTKRKRSPGIVNNGDGSVTVSW